MGSVPFALAAGLSSISPAVVVTAGLAEITAGAIAMGLGGGIIQLSLSLSLSLSPHTNTCSLFQEAFSRAACSYCNTRGWYLAAKSDWDHYVREKRHEELDILTFPDDEAEVAEIFCKLGLQPSETKPLVDALQKRPNDWLEFMMRFELGLEKPDPRRALRSGLTIASSYIIGGLIPLLPYMVVQDMRVSLLYSIGVTLLALLAFGYVKGALNGTRAICSAIHTAAVGALASSAAFVIANCRHAH
ncbi:hypothetical protein L7F22_029891 [Adiantum nelumboides]|nr:hypothetical protein [Adiantum nelumboides]